MPTSSVGISAAPAKRNVMGVCCRCSSRRRAFTLIEIMVVTVLMGLMVATVTVGMSGFTEAGRWRAAVTQINAANRQARLEACTTGVPRRLDFAAGGSCIQLKRPRQASDGWIWTLSRRFDLPQGTHLEAIVRRDGTRRDALRIGPDGASQGYAFVLRRGERRVAVVFDDWSGVSRTIMDLSVGTNVDSLFDPGADR